MAFNPYTDSDLVGFRLCVCRPPVSNAYYYRHIYQIQDHSMMSELFSVDEILARLRIADGVARWTDVVAIRLIDKLRK